MIDAKEGSHSVLRITGLFLFHQVVSILGGMIVVFFLAFMLPIQLQPNEGIGAKMFYDYARSFTSGVIVKSIVFYFLRVPLDGARWVWVLPACSFSFSLLWAIATEHADSVFRRFLTFGTADEGLTFLFGMVPLLLTIGYSSIAFQRAR